MYTLGNSVGSVIGDPTPAPPICAVMGRRVSSHSTRTRVCLDSKPTNADDLPMESTEAIFRQLCFRCERPALTFDEQQRALCSRHARIFIAAKRVIDKDDEWWMNISPVEASAKS